MTTEPEEQEISDAEHRRKLVKKRLERLMQSNPQLYYEATTAVARAVHDNIQCDESLNDMERGVVNGLTVRDIEIILAFR